MDLFVRNKNNYLLLLYHYNISEEFPKIIKYLIKEQTHNTHLLILAAEVILQLKIKNPQSKFKKGINNNNSLVISLIKQFNYSEALKQLEILDDLHSKSADYHYWKGLAYLGLNELDIIEQGKKIARLKDRQIKARIKLENQRIQSEFLKFISNSSNSIFISSAAGFAIKDSIQILLFLILNFQTINCDLTNLKN